MPKCVVHGVDVVSTQVQFGHGRGQIVGDDREWLGLVDSFVANHNFWESYRRALTPGRRARRFGSWCRVSQDEHREEEHAEVHEDEASLISSGGLLSRKMPRR